MKNKKKKNNNKIWTGLAAGAAVGFLTFLLVKPKSETKQKETISDNVKTEKGSASTASTLFV